LRTDIGENISREINVIREFLPDYTVRLLWGGRRTLEDFEGVFLGAFSSLFNTVGSLLIIYGGLRAILGIILLEALKKPFSYQQIRKEFTNKIIFGLEFFIAADVMETVRNPSQEELILLGTVVLIRTVLGYFLSKEVSEYQLD
jgi:uncharacterized membrane protein